MNNSYPQSSSSLVKINLLCLFHIFIYSFLNTLPKSSATQKREAYPKKSVHLWKRYRRRARTFHRVRNSPFYRLQVWTIYEISSYEIHMKISHCPFLLCKKMFSILEDYHSFRIIVNSQMIKNRQTDSFSRKKVSHINLKIFEYFLKGGAAF